MHARELDIPIRLTIGPSSIHFVCCSAATDHLPFGGYDACLVGLG
jgi:hypothetical protein